MVAAALWTDTATAQDSPAGGATVQDIALRDELIAAQESLLNVYRCRFGVDVEVVPGGCVGGQPAQGATEPGVFGGLPSLGELATRDRLVADQERLLNTYRCRFGIDSGIVPGGCVAFEEGLVRHRLAERVLEEANGLRGDLVPLQIDGGLSAAAQSKAQAQARADDWLGDFDYRPLLESDWGVWHGARSIRLSVGLDWSGLVSGVSESLLDLDEGGLAILGCDWCTHLGVGVAANSSRTYATFVLAGPSPSESSLAAAEAEVADLVNRLRQGLGLGELSYHDGVARVARGWSQTMAEEQKLEHNPSYTQQYPSGWTKTAENIAKVPLSRTISEAVRRSFDLLAESPGHHANMANPDLTHIGVGITVEDGQLWVTQNFAGYPAGATDPQDENGKVGDFEVAVFYCAQTGKYSAHQLLEQIESLNGVLTDYFLRESGGLATIRLVEGGIISPAIDWSDITENSIHSWQQQNADTNGRYRDPCDSSVPRAWRVHQILILADVPHSSQVTGYAYTGQGLAVVPVADQFQFGMYAYRTLVAHELSHSLLGLRHPSEDIPRDSCSSRWNLMDRRVCDGLDNSEILENSKILCGDRTQLGWPCERGDLADNDPKPTGGESVELRQTSEDAADEGKCKNSCTWQAVTVTGFAPATYSVECWSLNTADGTPLSYQTTTQYSVTIGTDGTGTNSRICWNGHYADVAQHSADVYVTVGGVQSNTITLRRRGS